MMAVKSASRIRPRAAVVMNLFYTGLGIARSLGERGVRVVGLSAHRSAYGNVSRYVRTVRCADSAKQPEKLIEQLIELGDHIGPGSVLFPTRDHDLVFIDRFRSELEPYFVPVVPPSEVLQRCLNKWDTYRVAVEAGVPSPKSWLVESAEDLQKATAEITYPCVLKPLAAHHWRADANWELVGGRKAINVASRNELLAEAAIVARADRRMLVQETVPGGDDGLVVAACYVDRQSRFRAGFNIQKLVQTPAGFGTGCIVQSTDRPELFERTLRLLEAMQFTGIAEVEYKWDGRDHDYKLIEINPRPWDQHRLAAACGVDLVHLAYCDHAGEPEPVVQTGFVQKKWIAEDTFALAAMRLLWRRERGLGELFRHARGQKVYGIWSANDPLPFLFFVAMLLPSLFRMVLQALGRGVASNPAKAKTIAPALPAPPGLRRGS